MADRTYPTPAEVRDMLGGEPSLRDDVDLVPDEEYANVIHIERAFEDNTTQERCASCGLIGLCWCQPGCEFCNYPPIRDSWARPHEEVS